MENSSDFHYSGIEQLRNSEKNLSRYRRYLTRKFLLNTITLNSNKTILEFGAGTGSLAEIIKREFKHQVLCLEIDSTLQEIIKERGLKTVSSLKDLIVSDSKFDLIYSSNVLEHIEDDMDTIRSLGKLLRDNNSELVIYVPAHMWLWSELDRKVGHFRRYSKSELVQKVTAAGLTVKSIEWVDPLGIFATLLIKWFGYDEKNGLGNGISMKAYDMIAHPISAFLNFIGFRFLVGNNLLIRCKNEI